MTKQELKSWIFPIVMTLIIASVIICCAVRNGRKELKQKRSIKNNLVKEK